MTAASTSRAFDHKRGRPGRPLATPLLAAAAIAVLAGCAVGPPATTATPAPAVPLVTPTSTLDTPPAPTSAASAASASTGSSTPASATTGATRTTTASPQASGTTTKPSTTKTTTASTAPGGSSTSVPATGTLAGMVTAAGAYNRPSTGGARLAPTASGRLDGRVIMVDPGHNGVMISSIDNALVPAGHGTTKACNTSGTESVDGTPEYQITWAIGIRLIGLLRAQGATVVLTHPDTNGVGPCVNERAAIANRSNVDLVLSIHGDGADVAGARGFHVIVSSIMEGGSGLQSRSYAVAQTLVRQLETRTPLPRSTYVGSGTGIDRRSDIAGMNLLTGAPGIMLEMGNLRSSADWSYLKTAGAKDDIANALAATAIATLG